MRIPALIKIALLICHLNNVFSAKGSNTVLYYRNFRDTDSVVKISALN